MSEPNWATVVLTAYRSEEGTVQWVDAVEEEHDQRKQNWPFDLRKVTDLSNEEIESAIRFAERTELLSQVGTGVHYRLTQKGFEVAHDRELRKEQQSLTKGQKEASDTLADFTVILGITALIQAFAAVISAPRYNLTLATVYVMLLGALLYKRDDWIHST
ncbi:hypothetical protein [Halorussus sp. AFM4]|uniref:hypothetical protein n=1 Tax=Halorussus sp. AFM4 TaxID=3421651 RepID=UPI003EBC51AA